MKAPAVADGQHDAGLARRRDRPIRPGAVERDRFLDMDVLARRGGGDDLRFMQAVWGSEHDRVDFGIGQKLLVAAGERHAVGAAEIFRRCPRACVSANEG
jgi:hypothetical protein